MSPSSRRHTCPMLRDPVRRAWFLGRLRRRWPALREDFIPHHPPELTDAVVAALAADRPGIVSPLPAGGAPPQGRLLLRLPGETVGIDSPAQLFTRDWTDRRAEAGAHAFAWLAHAGAGGAPVDAAWGAALWAAWAERHGSPAAGPAWAPPVVAARILAWLDHAARWGWPSGLAPALAEQGRHLAARLDYRGERATTLDLTAEAHALARLGLALAMPATADFGFALLLGEAGRRLAPSGLLRDGSSLDQLRLVRLHADAWLAARRAGRPETAALAGLVRRGLGALGLLALPGGLPFIGADEGLEPPEQSFGLLPEAENQGWTARLPADEAAALRDLAAAGRQADFESLRAEGWLRLDHGPWSGLWHASPAGWPERRAHHDMGGFELHYDGVPVFVDPGDGPAGLGAFYRGAAAHSGLQIGEATPYPDDHPAYAPAFRQEIGGKPPVLRAEADGASLRFEGYQRLGGPREVIRRWHFAPGGVLGIADFVNGTGRFRISRRLVTPLEPTLDADGGVLLGCDSGRRFRLRAERPALVVDGQRSRPDGGLARLWIIVFAEESANLPYRRHLTVEPL